MFSWCFNHIRLIQSFTNITLKSIFIDITIKYNKTLSHELNRYFNSIINVFQSYLTLIKQLVFLPSLKIRCDLIKKYFNWVIYKDDKMFFFKSKKKLPVIERMHYWCEAIYCIRIIYTCSMSDQKIYYFHITFNASLN